MSLFNDLRAGEFFKDLPYSCLEKISGLCEEEILQDQDIIFEEGAPAEKIYILHEGAVALQVRLSKYQEIIISTIEEKGELFTVAEYFFGSTIADHPKSSPFSSMVLMIIS